MNDGRRALGGRRWLHGAIVIGTFAVGQGTVAYAGPSGATAISAPRMTVEAATRFAELALACVGKEYPGKIAHVLESASDVKSPRELTPSFFGCYDWHSAVHGHWLLVRLIRTFPTAPFVAKAREALAEDLAPKKIAGEVLYMGKASRMAFERPYGLAWLLQLAAELRSWDDPQAKDWATALAPLESLAATRLKDWLPKLLHPIRIGEHDQTAFSFGLIWDWSLRSGDVQMTELLRSRIGELYLGDRACPLAYEPGGQDFLSPCLAEADLVRRVLSRPEYAIWLTAFLPQVPRDGSVAWLKPADVPDRSDPKLGHLDGLNLSRAWMIEGIARALPPRDPRVRALHLTSQAHIDAALPHVTGEHYEGGHWLGTFAVYLLSTEQQEGSVWRR
ncbi:MAG: DUF2891 domain-containing protein [Vicinamibacteria bacterium]